MNFTVALLLATFLMSLVALFLYVWSMSRDLFGNSVNASLTIFNKNELDVVDDPAATISQLKALQQTVTGHISFDDGLVKEELVARADADSSSSLVVGICFTLAVIYNSSSEKLDPFSQVLLCNIALNGCKDVHTPTYQASRVGI